MTSVYLNGVTIVTSAEALTATVQEAFRQEVIGLSVKSPSLGKDGVITTLEIQMKQDVVHIVDLVELSPTVAFNDDPFALKSLLQNEGIIKLVFDVSNMGNTLWHAYGVRLCNIVDLQLFQMTLIPTAKWNMSFHKCLQHAGLWDTERASERAGWIIDLRNSCAEQGYFLRPLTFEMEALCYTNICDYLNLLRSLQERSSQDWQLQVPFLSQQRYEEACLDSYRSDAEACRLNWLRHRAL